MVVSYRNMSSKSMEWLVGKLISFFCFLLLFLNLFFYFYKPDEGPFNEKFSSLLEESWRISNSEKLLHLFDYNKKCKSVFRTHTYEFSASENATKAMAFHRWLKGSGYETDDTEAACLYVFVASADDSFEYIRPRLEFFESARLNHLVLFVDASTSSWPLDRHSHDAWKTIFVGSNFGKGSFLPNVDLNVFTGVPDYDKNARKEQLDFVELSRRKQKLLSFVSRTTALSAVYADESAFFDICASLPKVCLLNTSCARSEQENSSAEFFTSDERFGICEDLETREMFGIASHFTLIFSHTSSAPQRLFEALRHNSIPVVVDDFAALPFGDFIDWSTAVVHIPRRSLPDAVKLLADISEADRVEKMRLGHFYLKNYIGDGKVLVRSILSAVRHRLMLNAPLERLYSAETMLTIMPGNGTMENASKETLKISEVDDIFEDGIYEKWNRNPTYLDASSAIRFAMTPIISTDEYSSLLVNNLNRKKYPTFATTLSGNHVEEDFTIIVLSYKRDNQLLYTLKNMDGLAFLDSIIVIWNDVTQAPLPADRWPRIHVPIRVVNATRNSLNNRFLPLEMIRTEAVFSMDDDFNVEHDDILFSFRVWRENRDQIVGPNFRLGYIEDGKGVYNTNALCQYNMVLTSGAFVHYSYLRAYTYEMPELIREHIDKLNNCEDIAINFLVSHLTRKPPIKTTPIKNTKGKFTSSGLSTRSSHYQERAECVSLFVSVFGYNPLIMSEYRADSVLFKIRGYQCFRYT